MLKHVKLLDLLTAERNRLEILNLHKKRCQNQSQGSLEIIIFKSSKFMISAKKLKFCVNFAGFNSASTFPVIQHGAPSAGECFAPLSCGSKSASGLAVLRSAGAAIVGPD